MIDVKRNVKERIQYMQLARPESRIMRYRKHYLYDKKAECESKCRLLHDAAEAYIGDITTPLKRGLDSVGCDVGFVVPEGQVSKIEALELRWLLAIGEAFGLGDWLARPPVIVRQADAKMFAIEVPQLFHPVQSSWWENRERPRSGEVSIQCWPPAEARRQFINRFRVLYEILQSGPGWTEIEAGRP